MAITVLRPASSDAGPLETSDQPLTAELGRVLVSHGFAGDAVPAALGTPPASGNAHIRDDVPLYLRRLAEPTPLHTLIKLFVLLQPVDDAAVRDALAPLSLEHIERLGLLARGPEGVTASLRLSGCAGLVLAHDTYDRRASVSRDHVLDVNPTTRTLAALLVRRRVRSTLDVGTGCGVLALMTARHSERVVGVDTNPRALNFARFNAALNDVHNVEFREGSLFDPVEGERFDLIACNPPYVISPESRYIFRDGNRRGHGFCEEVVRRAPQHLEEGGYATVLCNWGIAAGEDWSAPLRRWVSSSGCDTWMLCSGTQDPLTYAATWNSSPDRAAYERALESWPAYHRELGFEKIGLGAVILRRRAEGTGWVRTDRFPDGSLEPDESLIPRIFDAQDLLSQAHTDDALLARAFVPAGHRLEQTLTLRDGRYVAGNGSQIALDGGLKFRGDVDPYTIHLLTCCDGRRTLGDISADLAAKTATDHDATRRATAAICRRLVSLGFLVPAQ
ncbi:MAG TPA: methyltransferase [Vicinamibacterales bacterium]|nr:methyltransferase [Vicinamibacterales bacterium]